MVDTSSLAGVMAASRRPQADQSTRRTAGVRRPATQEQPSFLDQLGENFLRGQQAQIRSNAVDNPFNPVPVSSSAVFEGRMPTAGELGTDAAFLAGGALLGAGVGAAAKPIIRKVGAYRAMSPENQALYNSMMRGLYHGDRSTGANVAQPFNAVNREPLDWARNWFGGDMFGTTSRPLGNQYASSNAGRAAFDEAGKLLPGFTREGFPVTRGATYRLSEPMEQVAQRNILDLTGRTLDEADPALYARLSEEFADDIAYEGTDLAQMLLSGPGLHQARYSERLRPILDEFGYDTIRHLSGQLQGDIVSPVYAFLSPEGLRATPALPSAGRIGDLMDAGVSSVAQNIGSGVGAFNQSVRQGGKNFLDELASVLSYNDLSQAPDFIRRFAEYRTRPLPFGEGFPDTIPHGESDRLNALFRRLGLNRIWREPEINYPSNPPIDWDADF